MMETKSKVFWFFAGVVALLLVSWWFIGRDVARRSRLSSDSASRGPELRLVPDAPKPTGCA
jgi:hypothetical protein